MEIKTKIASGIAVAARKQKIGPVDIAIKNAVNYLLGCQHKDGYWLGELEGDTILESEYIITLVFLGKAEHNKLTKAAEYIRRKQNPDGGWSLFPGGPTDVSSSVKAYFALKLMGDSPDMPYMVKARDAINAVGGISKVNSYTRFYLAMMGQIPWSAVPAVPPEMILLPPWFYFNIYAISSWSRTFVVPLGIIWDRKLTKAIDHSRGISELLTPDQKSALPLKFTRNPFTWRNFFLAADRVMKMCETLRLLPFRRPAVRKCTEWMLDHLEYSAGLGAIFPPMIYTTIAFKALDCGDDDPRVRRAMEELEKLEIEEAETLRLQPCMSPVWDTAIAVLALSEAGTPPGHPALRRAGRWLLDREIRIAGDWKVKRPYLQPGGWCFEFANDFYPDIDDTAMVLMALRRVGNMEGKTEACKRAILWLIGMQGKNGGWASFDVDNNRKAFNHIPFADHNAMLDPGTSDITARMLEMLSQYSFTENSSVCKKAIGFIDKEQEQDGSWFGRWGVNYIYGTWQAIRGLAMIGLPPEHPVIQSGAEWLLRIQNEDGSWGESCISYADTSEKGRGPGTASQTAWAVMGLINSGYENSRAVKDGIDYLIRTQNENGTWDEEWFTGTGFPLVFYLRYHLYKHSFPLMALGMYKRLAHP